MAQLFTNNGTSTLTTAITPLDISLVLPAEDAELFPVIDPVDSAEYSIITLQDAAGVFEVLKCTGTSGSIFTVERGQEGTLAVDWPVDTRIELRVTMGAMSRTISLTAPQETGGELTDNLAAGGHILTGLGVGVGVADSVTKGQLDEKAPILDPVFVNTISMGAATVNEAELEVLDGAVISTAELNFSDGVTSNIQVQLDAKNASLGFTPVEQGGGIGQTTNKIHVGWSGAKLKGQVDGSDLGDFYMTSNPPPVGGGYSRTVLFTGSLDSSTANIADINAYDQIFVHFSMNATTSNQNIMVHDRASIVYGQLYVTNGKTGGDSNQGTIHSFPNNTQITESGYGVITLVLGINY
jgi:hypothetical protein